MSGTGSGPGLSCSGAALVRVKGNPFTTYAGIGGIVATALGIAGMVLGGGGAGGIAPGRVARKALAGMLAAVGGLVLAQQAAIVYPTGLVAIIGLALGAGVGALSAIIPGLGKAAAGAAEV